MQSGSPTAPSNPALTDQAFLGHPRGLAYLAGTEAWIGFSYYGMQSLLVLYMTSRLLTPAHMAHVLGFEPFRAALSGLYGPLAGQPLASAIMGLYGALVYATPILGGMVADRWLGRTRTVLLGAVLMTAGHFLMTFDAGFLIALACLVLGMGCAGTLKAQVGGFYAPADLRRADGFQIYTLALSIAVILAPLVCGTLGERWGWSWGFAAAGLGMLIGLVVYLSGRRWLPPEPPRVRRAAAASQPARLSGREWRTIAVLALLLPVLAVAAIGNMEIFNGYIIWGRANYQLQVFGQTMPVSWLVSLDALVSSFTLAGSVAFWRWWRRRRREPDEIVKMAFGAMISAAAPLILALASAQAAGGHKVGLAWGLAFHLVNDIGFANVYAVGLALYARAAPPSVGSTLINAYSLHLFLANLLVGRLAGFLARMPGESFWLMHAGLMAGAAAILLVCARLFGPLLAPLSEADR